jgi:fructose-bisphosphate aldolase class II
MIATLNDVLKDAQAGKYAVGLFNTTDTDMLEAAIGAAEELRAPIIIGTAEVLLPYGDLALIAPSIVEAAKRATVPVVAHYDHGLTFDRTMEALKLGFSSVMFDASTKDSAANLAETAEVVKIAHSFGATVEGEISHVGQASNGDESLEDMYTTPEEADAFIKATGVDALAIAIGSAHGVYKTKPRLNLERLKEIRAKVDAPLVLHGGSGLSDDDFRNTIREGIAKVNIFTDLLLAGEAAMKEGLERNLGYLETRNLRVEKIKQAVKTKIELFGCAGKA